MDGGPEPRGGQDDSGRRSDTLTGNLRRVLDALRRMLRGEATLLRAEAGRSLRDAGRGIALILVTAIVAFVGMLVLAAAMVLGLMAWGLSPFASALLIGFGLIVVALGVLQYALRLLSADNLTPRRSIDSLRRDLEALGITTGKDRGEND